MSALPSDDDSDDSDDGEANGFVVGKPPTVPRPVRPAAPAAAAPKSAAPTPRPIMAPTAPSRAPFVITDPAGLDQFLADKRTIAELPQPSSIPPRRRLFQLVRSEAAEVQVAHLKFRDQQMALETCFHNGAKRRVGEILAELSTAPSDQLTALRAELEACKGVVEGRAGEVGLAANERLNRVFSELVMPHLIVLSAAIDNHGRLMAHEAEEIEKAALRLIGSPWVRGFLSAELRQITADAKRTVDNDVQSFENGHAFSSNGRTGCADLVAEILCRTSEIVVPVSSEPVAILEGGDRLWFSLENLSNQGIFLGLSEATCREAAGLSDPLQTAPRGNTLCPGAVVESGALINAEFHEEDIRRGVVHDGALAQKWDAFRRSPVYGINLGPEPVKIVLYEP